MMYNKIITILGPTATGKTKVATALAYRLDGEIVSADSRQLYKNMDIGTGKDLQDYEIKECKIPYHLINVAEAGEEYNVFLYHQAAKNALNNITQRGKQPILCGGSGMYIDALLNGYRLFPVPENQELRQQWALKTLEELTHELIAMRPLHNDTDICDRDRLLRALEIEYYYKEHPDLEKITMPVASTVFGLRGDRDLIRAKITKRLHERLEQGMVEEVQHLLDKGVNPNQMIRYGLEYKFITLYLQGILPYNIMTQRLNTAIHQFSKRQMTWFRKMEREGCSIHWIDIEHSVDEIVEMICTHLIH